MKCQVEVTAEHIANGSNSSISCPVALAILEACSDIEQASVWPTIMYFKLTDGTERHIDTGRSVGNWIRSFDNWYNFYQKRFSPPKPISFELENS